MMNDDNRRLVGYKLIQSGHLSCRSVMKFQIKVMNYVLTHTSGLIIDDDIKRKRVEDIHFFNELLMI